jgi:alpha-1,3-rhamnosyl/mannosyltransferase
MRIGIDIRKYQDYGIGTYIQNLVNAFQSQPDLDCIYYASDDFRSDGLDLQKGKIVTDSSPKYSLQELISLSKKANSDFLDLYHAPHYTLPVNLKMPGIVTIHDIIHLRLKKYFSFPKRSYAYFMVRHACSASSAIIVDSEHGKNELLDVFRIDQKKIHVIPLGVDQSYFTKVTEEDKITFRQKHSITKPYILYTGSLKPHKNVPVLLRAFKEIVREHDIQLVFTGERVQDNPSLIKFIGENRLTEAVKDLGRIDRAQLRIAYQTASVVVLPSFYEGFGFSMLEAMASGVPAIGARAASIPEVVGDAGVLFDPNDEHELAQHVVRVLTDKDYSSNLIKNGNERAQQFSWSRCAEKTLQVYAKVAR